MPIRTQLRDRMLTIGFDGDFHESFFGSGGIDDVIRGLDRKKARAIILDFENVTKPTQQAVGKLIELSDEMWERQQPLILLYVSSETQDVLDRHDINQRLVVAKTYGEVVCLISSTPP